VIAGEFRGIKGPASTFTPIQMYDVRLKKNSELTLEISQDQNSLLLVTRGSFNVNNALTKFKDMVLFGRQGENISLKAHEDGMVFILSGTPIEEPVASSGPFVMNTEQEIAQAFRDYRSGKFGSL
jgi:redox-sensitive bicupin YhaK (pirin superfamily)